MKKATPMVSRSVGESVITDEFVGLVVGVERAECAGPCAGGNST